MGDNMKKLYIKPEYEHYVNEKMPKTNTVKNIVWAFIVGGLICDVGQLIRNFFEARVFTNEQIGNITIIIMIFLGALFTGLNVYDELGKYAGAGSIVPITGFANSIVSPAMEFKSEGYVMGVGAKMFVIAGPVIVYGILVSVVSGIIYYILT